MKALYRIGLAVPLVVVVALPAVAADPWVPIYNLENVYVHCNAAKVTVTQHATYAWNTTAPTTALTANGGCGSLDSDKLAGDGVTWTGKHTGNLDRLTVKAWVVDVGPVRPGLYPEIWGDVNVTIDGFDVVSGVEAHLPPITGGNGIARRLEFSVTGIGLLDEEDYKEHDVSVSLETAAYLDGDQLLWVLDASDVPSGVTFSPTTLANVIIDAG